MKSEKHITMPTRMSTRGAFLISFMILFLWCSTSLYLASTSIHESKNSRSIDQRPSDVIDQKILSQEIKTLCNSNNVSASAIVHAGKESDMIVELTSSTPNDGFLAWANNDAKSKYNHSMYIPTSADSCKGLAFYWTIDRVDRKIHIAAAVHIGSEQGFAAIGFSETGGMRGADVVYVTSSSLNAVDSYILDSLSAPIADDEQNWALNNRIVTEDGYLIFEVSRELDTGDSFDRAFVDDSSPFVSNHRLIASWGPHEFISYHGHNRVHRSIQLFSESRNDDYDVFLQDMSTRMDGLTDLVADFPIPQEVTHYHTECFKNIDLFDLGLFTEESPSQHVIGYEFLLQSSTRKYIHHMVVFGKYGDCGDKNDEKSLVFVFTPGEEYFNFPHRTGIKFGEGGFLSIEIQYHIENRSLDEGMVSSGIGIRLFHSNKSVEQEIGMAMIGDPFVKLAGVEIGEGFTRHSFTCPSTCTENKLDADAIIVKEQLHMHSHGKRIVNQVIRDDSIVHESYIDYFDFEQDAGPAQKNPPFQLKRGDKFRTICYYENGYSDTIFGQGTNDEMCMAFIFYFPKQALSFCGVNLRDDMCKTSYDGKDNLDTPAEFGRVFADAGIADLS